MSEVDLLIGGRNSAPDEGFKVTRGRWWVTALGRMTCLWIHVEMPVWKLETGVWTLKEQSMQCGLESPLACRWWKSAWVSYVTWHSASVLFEDFTEDPGNPGNAFSFSSGSEGMGLNPEEESVVAGESHRADNLCSMGWLPLLASCLSLFLFRLFTRESWVDI